MFSRLQSRNKRNITAANTINDRIMLFVLRIGGTIVTLLLVAALLLQESPNSYFVEAFFNQPMPGVPNYGRPACLSMESITQDQLDAIVEINKEIVAKNTSMTPPIPPYEELKQGTYHPNPWLEVADRCVNEWPDEICGRFRHYTYELDASKKARVWKRSKLCENQYFKNVAIKCRKYCYTCCEDPKYKCEDKKFEARINRRRSAMESPNTRGTAHFKCNGNSALEGLCNEPWAKPILKLACPQYCGFCAEHNKEQAAKAKKKKSFALPSPIHQDPKCADEIIRLRGKENTDLYKPFSQNPLDLNRARFCVQWMLPPKDYCYAPKEVKDDRPKAKSDTMRENTKAVNFLKNCKATCGQCVLPFKAKGDGKAFICKDRKEIDPNDPLAEDCMRWQQEYPMPRCQNPEYSPTCGMCPTAAPQHPPQKDDDEEKEEEEEEEQSSSKKNKKKDQKKNQKPSKKSGKKEER